MVLLIFSLHKSRLSKLQPILCSKLSSTRFPTCLERHTEQPENPYSRQAPNQTYAIIPEFTFESGHTLRDVPVAYKTWGVLNAAADNVMLVCHPLTRSVDIEDW